MPLLEIRDLTVKFNDGPGVEAVRGVSLTMERGEKLGLVGESGSGKTMLALTVAGLTERGKTTTTGEVLLNGADLLKLSRSELRTIQGRDIGMVFQEPMSSLDPLMKVGRQIEETLKIHTELTAQERRRLAVEVMGHVGLPEPERCYNKYPHQLSGGQRQRAMIAAAFISDPQLLIADEPTTALDVTVQAQIITLLGRVNAEKGVGILFISHDLSVVRKLCTRVAVMYGGRIVEEGPTEDIFKNPQDDYTRRLISAIPTRRKR